MFHIDAVFLDHGICENVMGDLVDLFAYFVYVAVELDLEVLALTHVHDVDVAEAVESRADSATLGVENRFF